MGCCTSNIRQHRGALNTTSAFEEDREAYMPPSGQRLSSKRSYSSRISMTGSSGVFSRCSTPSKRSVLSRCSTPSRAPTPKPKPNMVNYQECQHKRQQMPDAFKMLSICDDFGDAECLDMEQQQHGELNKSNGYFSRSISTPTNSHPNSPTSTPNKSRMRYTQDIGEASELNITAPKANSFWDLEMEMYMMSHADNFMPKTSSPIFHRRDITIEVAASPRCATSYEKWRNHLQSSPAYMTNNITRIPEAIAGQFSPSSFPAFSDLGEMDSAPKRYKMDVAQQSLGGGTIITTEL